MTPLLELKDIRRSYPAGDEQVEVLKGITLDIYAVSYTHLDVYKRQTQTNGKTNHYYAAQF